MKTLFIVTISLFLSVCTSSNNRCNKLKVYMVIKRKSSLITSNQWTEFIEEQEEWIRTPLKDGRWTIPLYETERMDGSNNQTKEKRDDGNEEE